MTSVLLAAEQEKWKESRSSHFLIYYNQAPEDFVRNVELSAEEEYETIAQNLGFTRYEGWSWDRRARVYIYDDQEHYVGERNVSWSHGMALVQEKVIRTFPTAAGFFDSTLPHELGHIIFREFVGYKSKIPLWLDEGVAMYQEKAKRWGANKLVARAISEGKFIPLKELSRVELTNESDQATIELFYAEAASIVYFMITELGDYRFVNFCRHLKEGCRLDDAIHRAYARFQNMDDLNEAWVKYLSP
ncbi:MAG TPA: peptidase MA family metallohydrolase [Candidatus Omnitrophota bacterium]|nr:peptidase MA family metallohydrolase [Candidatus Omnitrophota bacterium]